MPSRNDFLEAFPEFKGQDQEKVDAALASADVLTDADQFGDMYERAVMLWAAYQLTQGVKTFTAVPASLTRNSGGASLDKRNQASRDTNRYLKERMEIQSRLIFPGLVT